MIATGEAAAVVVVVAVAVVAAAAAAVVVAAVNPFQTRHSGSGRYRGGSLSFADRWKPDLTIHLGLVAVGETWQSAEAKRIDRF